MLGKSVIALSLILLWHSQGWAVPFEISKNEQAWLKAHPEIRVGLLNSSPPQSMVDKNGKAIGIDPEVLKLLNSKLSGQLKSVTGPWREIYNDTKEKRLDVLMCLTPSKERLAYFNYTRPYMSDPHVIIAKENGPHFGNLATLKGHTVALAHGVFLVSYLQSHYPGIKIKEYVNPLASLRAIQRGEAQAYIGSRIVVEYLMVKNNIYDLDIHALSNETSETNVIAVRKDWPELASILDKALASISHNELHAAMDHWGQALTQKITNQNIKLTDEEVIWIQQHPNIVVGVENNWPPYDFFVNSKAVGFANDYIRLLAKKAGLNLQFTHSPTLVELLAKLERKEVDLLPALSKTPERQKFANFTSSYIDKRESLVVHRNSKNIYSLDDMTGKRLARIEGYSSNKMLMEKYPGIEIVFVANAAEGLLSVVDGSVDGYMDYLGVINYLRREYLIEDLRVANTNSLPSAISALRIGVRKDWEVLAEILEKVMGSVTSDEYSKLKRNWFSSEEMNLNEFQLAPAEKTWISGLGTLRMGIPIGWPPFSFAGENGNHQGIAKEYTKIIKNKLGLNLKVIAGPWQDIQARTSAGDIDILPSLNETENRKEFLSFTKPYLRVPIIIATRTDAPYYPHIDDLTDIIVGVGEGYAIQEKLSRDYPEITIRGYATIGEALLALKSGEISGLIANSAVFAFFQNKLELQSTTHINNTTPYEDLLAIGVRHKLAPLVPLLNRVLSGISPEEHELIMNKWINLPVHKQTDWNMVWRVAGGSVIVLIFVLLWNFKMTIEVKKRRKAEAKLSESEERFRRTFAQAAVGIAHVAPDGRFLLINQKFCDIVGYTRKEMLEGTFQKITHPDDLKTNMEYVRQMLAGEIFTYVMEKRYIKKDGSVVWVNLTVSLVHTQSGKPKYFISVIEDITERKNAQEERDRILNLSYDLIAVASMDGYFKYVNPAWAKTLGYAKEELLNNPFLDFIHPDDQSISDAEIESLAAGKETIGFENRYIAKNGTIHTISWAATPLVSERLIYCIGRDRTENKLAEIKLKKQQQLLDATGRVARIGGWELNTQTFDLSWTRELYRIHEVGNDFVPTVDNAINFYTPEARRQIGTAVKNTIKSGAPFDLEFQMQTAKGNQIWVRSISQANTTGGIITSIFGTFQDISIRKKADEEKEKLESQLRKAHKMEAIVTMADGLTHNFNNILYSVLGYAEMARDEIPEESNAYKYLEEVLVSSHRARDLVQQIMSLSRQDGSIKEKLQPEILLNEAINSIRDFIPENITINENITSNLGEIHIDPSDFKKVITHILTNSLAAMQDEEGILGINLENVEFKSKHVLGDLEIAPGNFVKITVSDTGHGISTENMARIFNPFFTTKEVGQGEGIGLSVVQGIVTKCGGKIHVESAPGKGATFNIFFPITR